MSNLEKPKSSAERLDELEQGAQRILTDITKAAQELRKITPETATTFSEIQTILTQHFPYLEFDFSPPADKADLSDYIILQNIERLLISGRGASIPDVLKEQMRKVLLANFKKYGGLATRRTIAASLADLHEVSTPGQSKLLHPADIPEPPPEGFREAVHEAIEEAIPLPEEDNGDDSE